MLESHRLQIERAEVQNSLNSDRFLELRANDADYETRMGERKVLNDQLTGLNSKLIDALNREDTEAQAAVATNADTRGWTAELREFRAIAQRTSIADYFAATIEGRGVTGSAKEYNEHVLGAYAPGDYPLEMLLDRDELLAFDPFTWQSLKHDSDESRAIITGIAGTHGNPTFVDRLLANSEAAYLMARSPAVGPGRHSYPIVTGSTVAAETARDTAETPAGGLTIVNSDPSRIQHSYEYAVADELQVPGVANGLADDLRMSLASGLDRKVVRDLLSGLTAEDVTAGTTVTAAGLIAAVHSVVDGRAARYFGEVRLLAGNGVAASQTTAFERIGALLSAATIDAVFTWMANIRASAHMPNASGGEDNIIAIKTGSAATRLIVPVWRRGTLLRDVATQQLKGNIVITGVMYADVIVVNEDIHTQLRVETQ